MLRLLSGRMRYSEVVLLGFVIAIAAMLIIPLPTPLLDILLVLNISFSILLLLVGLYVSNSAALYTFPTILLLSTLFRLGLNVASSRLILSQGDAGRVIESFGTFLIRGEIVVGIIIFSIVTIVNFIVIAKGATRVSEVAARFFLDSLPGRQQVIDNDARAGVISAEEARKKRDHLRLESQLYGSMDGAMKFVQGDSVAGFFIIIVNIVGGVYMGVSSGLGVSDAIQTYTILTVGDGLVTQIPSLLTSICAGIIVTRVSSSETSTLGVDLRTQLFSQPVTLFVTALILLVFASMPGIPASPFLLVAVFAIGAGAFLVKREREMPVRGAISGEYRRASGGAAIRHERGVSEIGEGALTLEFDQGMLFKLYRNQAQRYTDAWERFNESFHADVGMVLPDMNIVQNELLAPSSYRVFHAGVEMFSGVVASEGLFVEISSCQAAVLGLPVIKEEEHPRSGHRVFWTRNTPEIRSVLDAGSVRSYDFFDYISLKIGSFCLRHPEEFLSVTDVHSLLRQIEKRHPGLIAEGFGKEFVPVPRLTELLHELVRQGISIRDFRGVIEGVASYCSANRLSVDDDSAVDVGEVVRHLRGHRRRQVLRRFLGTGNSLHVVSLSEDVERTLSDADFDNKSLPVAVDAPVLDALISGLANVLKPTLEQGSLPIALLCSHDIKEKVLSITRMTKHALFVTTFEELDPSIPVQQIGMWMLAER
jgi:type III secretion protein V